MVDVLYVRGWEDCLEAICIVIKQTKDYEDIKKKIKQLKDLVHENKFEKIRHELGAFGLF